MTTSRQNLLNIFRRRGIEHAVPSFDLCPAMVEKFAKHYGHTDYRKEFGFEIINVGAPFLQQNFNQWRERFFPNVNFLPTTSFDLWGVGHEKTPESMHMSRMHYPMKPFTTMDEFKSYPYPAFSAEPLGKLTEQVSQLHQQERFTCANMQCTIWEHAWYMRSMEEMMVGMMLDDDMTQYHLDRITELSCQCADAYAQADVDFLFLGDDIGMQHTIMMSRELYSKWLKPKLKAVIDAARARKPDILVGYHSCGFVEPFIDDLIEVGVDVLNPVQPECMEFSEIHAKYGSRISFWGTLGTQRLFPYGTAQDVYDKTMENLRIAGPNGGLLATPTHLVEPEVPLENIIAYVQACKDFKA